MKTSTKSTARAESGLLSIVFAAAIGVSLLFLAGFANSTTVHDFEHDTRHATGFPCH